jgi:hypothetical protein
MKTKKPKMPTEHQTRILRRIAASGCMMLTHAADKDRYTDATGVTIDHPTAKLMIRNNWLVPERDSMFDLTPQTWRVRTP